MSTATQAPPKRLDEIDWTTWRAVDRATLVFIVEDGRVLLIRKKRGLGAGKINGPGGRIEAGETPAQCGSREVQEELCVTPALLDARGELRFQFRDGYSIHVYVFVAHGFEGRPTETAEAIPLWRSLDEVPYDDMWEDDRLWLPAVLEGRSVDGQFLFEGDRMLDAACAISSASTSVPE